LRRRWLVACAALPVLSLVGCGGDDTGGWVTSMLHAAPDTPATRTFIIVNDEAGAARAFGVDVPTNDATPEERADYRDELLVDADVPVGLSPNRLSGADAARPATVAFEQVRRDLRAGRGRDAVQVVDLVGGDRIVRPGGRAAGGGETLGDRDDLRALAGALERHDVLAAFLSADTAWPPEGPPGDLDPYDAVAVGGAADDDGRPLLVVSLWHEDRDVAVHNANALRELAESDQPLTGATWAELVHDDVVERNGAVVTGVFWVDDPRLWYEMLSLGSPLVPVDPVAVEAAG